MRRRSKLGAVAGLIAGAVLLVPVLWLYAPGIDEYLGVMTGRALSLVRNHKEDGATIDQLVAAKYHDVRWRAYHRDFLGETYVRCEAVGQGGAPVTMVWVVMTTLSRRGVHANVTTVATAHTVSAYNIAPSLYQAGHKLYRSPDVANW
jgi:hypothetical protein